jgi:glycosyltransferase involved in cell wall biosynthesis
MIRRNGKPHVLLIVENVSLARDHRLRKQAAALVAAGYRVSVICRHDSGNTAVPGAVVYEYAAPRDAASKLGFVREYGYSLAMALALMTKLFLRDRFDVVQVSGTPDIYFTITAPFRWLGCAIVFDQRDLSPELYEIRYGRRDAIYRLLCRLERSSYRAADHIIVVNESLAQIAQARASVDRARLTIVGNGPELRSIQHGVLAGDENPGRHYLCCWVGMMGPQDQVSLALEAVHHVVRVLGRTDCQFVFIGEGECRVPAIERAAALGITSFVSFPGWLRQELAFGCISSADIAIEPNLEDIVSPVKGMEYMAFGVPFVAFDVAETRRLAGGAAAYVTPGNFAALGEKIDALLRDPLRRAEMGRIGVQRIRDEFAWDHQQDAYLDVFRGLTDRARARTEPHTSTEHEMTSEAVG